MAALCTLILIIPRNSSHAFSVPAPTYAVKVGVRFNPSRFADGRVRFMQIRLPCN
jgi:hypothetical protein